MTNEQLQRIKNLLRVACGADWCEADTLSQAVERLLAATETPALRDHCPSCYALSQVFVLTSEGERCPDPWHRPNASETGKAP